ncbi:MAG: B-box zinc finger protein [Dehalococcoidia bacterium]|nr:B-box zinc finger protein [Dehalococcoidia bacterium]MDD5493588.1 B-box zinc finger protein [Dehalococcoidia bacterium]
MKCSIHPDRDAIGACLSCGRLVCPECKVSAANQIYCNPCIETRLKTGSWPAVPAGGYNTSGTGSTADVPAEIRGWNWGGFLLTWIWGIGNNVWISLLALLSFIPYIGWIIGLTMRIILGIKGNEWAWRSKKWDSVDHFKQVQRKWTWWGIAGLAALIILVLAVAVLLFSLFMIASYLGIDKNMNLEEFFPKL